MDESRDSFSSEDAASSKTFREDSIGEILEYYLRRLENGDEPSAAGLLADHPDLASELGPALEKLRQLDVLARKPQRQALSSGCSNGELIGDFQIVTELARGGMGIVYEARQLSLNRTVALKVLPFGYLSDDRQVARFRNESRAAAMLEHPHIVPVYSIGMDRGVHFYAMQLIRGCSLAEALQLMPDYELLDEPLPAASQHAQWFLQHLQETPVPNTSDTNPPVAQPPASPRSKSGDAAPSTSHEPTKTYLQQVVRLALELADALAHAHERGVIHRDIKPANILVDENGNPWITDFGLARVRQNGTITATGTVIGTLRYMSPEQASGRPTVDERSDIYSLGATLYEWMLRRPLFSNADNDRLLNCILHESPLRPMRLVRRFPRDLETILMKCLEKRPDDRYSSANDLKNDLRNWLESRPIISRRPGPAERVSKWVSRNPTFAILATSLLLLILILGVGAVWYESRLQIASTQLQATDGTLQLQRQYTLRTQATRLAMDRPYRWRSQALAAIQEANTLGAVEADREANYTQTAALLAAIDIEPDGVLKHQDIVYALAVDQQNQKIAVGYNLVEGKVPVEIWNATDRKLERTVHFPADLNYVTTRGVRADGVSCLQFDRKGLQLAVGSRSGWIHYFDLRQADPQPVSWQASPAPLKQIRFSHDRTFIYSAAQNGTVTCWHIAKHEVRAQRELEPELSDFYLSRGSIFCGTDKGLRRLTAKTLDDEKSIYDESVKLCLLSPTRWHTVIAGDHGKLFQTDNMVNIAREFTNISGQPAHEGLIRSVTVHPDGDLIASTCNRQILKLWDASTGQCIRTITLGTTGRLHAAFVNRTLLAVTADRETRLFQINGKTYHGSIGAGAVQHTTFSENRSASENILSLAPSIAPDSKWHVRKWNETYPDQLPIFRINSPSDEVIHSLTDKMTLITNNYDVGKGGIGVYAFTKRVHQLECSNVRAIDEPLDRTQIWAACSNIAETSNQRIGGIRGWNQKDWSLYASWSNESAQANSDITAICSLATSSRWVAGGGEDGTVIVLQRQPFAFIHQLHVGMGRVCGVMFAPGEGLLLAAGDNGEIVGVDPERGQVVFRLPAHSSAILSIAVCRVAPIVVTGSADGELRVWKYDAPSSTLTRYFDLPRQASQIVRCRFTGDSLTLLSLAQADKQIHAWHLLPILETIDNPSFGNQP